jgi:GABA(A) receptor-associated protein
MSTSIKFKHQYSYDERKKEAVRITEKYPDRIPVICEKSWNCKMEHLHRTKFLIPIDFTMGQFMYVIRKRLRMPSEKGIFLFVSGTVQSQNTNMSQLFDVYKDVDGFLYVQYSDENVFGCGGEAPAYTIT